MPRALPRDAWETVAALVPDLATLAALAGTCRASHDAVAQLQVPRAQLRRWWRASTDAPVYRATWPVWDAVLPARPSATWDTRRALRVWRVARASGRVTTIVCTLKQLYCPVGPPGRIRQLLGGARGVRYTLRFA